MSYARNLLSRGEEVVFESRQHWFAIIGDTWLWLVALLLGAAGLVWWASNDYFSAEPWGMALGIGAGVLIVVPLIRILLVIWGWRNQEWLVTTRRVIRAEGVFNKNMTDSGLEKVNDAHLSQSIFGRIFGFGTLDILTAAEEEGGINDFPFLADPVKFKIAMMNQKEMLEHPELARPPAQRPGPPPEMQRVPMEPPRAGSDYVRQVDGDGATRVGADELADTLERLGQLRDRGLITPEEFEAKKRDLLERM
ncbi:MAG: PH domain-containing protein [Chloroflexota bacterium]|nr:PH domain-containing protein [Chloroflexota bacterium]